MVAALSFTQALPRQLITLFMASIIALATSLSTQAQGRHEGWYQVEMLVFSRPSSTSEEQFPYNITLAYPRQWVALKNPTPTAAASDATEPYTAPDLTREPFWQLPAAERSLNDQAHRLVRAGGYQLLFHQAWRQPITSAQRAPAIIINAGQSYGKHQQLEGTINLSVATYLKLRTNLWLTEFGVNVDSATQSRWPSLPLRPNYVAPETLVAQQAGTTSSANPLDNPLADWSNLSALEAEAADEPSPYIPTHMVLMQEERDMRSGEIHYLDHPLLGIIIQITPYNAMNTGDTGATQTQP